MAIAHRVLLPGSDGIPTERGSGARSAIQLILDSREAERRRISREIHDRIGQAMVSVRLSLAAARTAVETDEARELIEEGITAVDRAMLDVRRLAADLRSTPSLDAGLTAAIASLLASQARPAGFRGEFVSDKLDEPLPPVMEEACLGVAREALTNIARHAAARRVRVSLRVGPDALVLKVADDGVGFEPGRATKRASSTGLGLVGMAERVALLGGSLEVASRRGHGATVTARFPLGERADGQAT
jgi:signal transduction histidine kinase